MTSTQKILDLIKKNKIKNIRTLEINSNIANGTINRWKSEKTKPTADTIVKLAQYFNVSADYLLGLTDNPNPPKITLSKDEKEWLDIYNKLNKNQRSTLMLVALNFQHNNID